MRKMHRQQASNAGRMARTLRVRSVVIWSILALFGGLACSAAVMQGVSASSLTNTIAQVAQPSEVAKSAPAAPSDCGLAWHVATTPNADTLSNSFWDVDVISDNDIWAVGTYSHQAGSNTYTYGFAEHWNGSIWSLVTIPHPGTSSSNSYLQGISAASPNDVWAVGYYFEADVVLKTFIVHYDGTSWTQVASPNNGSHGNSLLDVAAVSSDAAWAVGGQGTPGGDAPTVLFWDGSNWASVPTPNPDLYDNLTAVTTTSADDMWAVGTMSSAPYDPLHPFSMHCTRAQCTALATPGSGVGDDELSDVKALSPSDVWAVGYSEVITNPTTIVPVMMHWNGEGWSTLPTPSIPGTINRAYFKAVVPLSDTAIWAIGSNFDDTNDAGHTFAEFWNGSSWAMSNPSNLESANDFEGADGLSVNDIWAVGSTEDSGGNQSQTLVEHYIDLCVTPTPTPPACSVDFTDVPQGSTFYPYVHCLSCQNILGGYTTGCPTGSPCFKPSSPVTRGQLAKIVSNAAGFNEIHTDQAFEDVASGSTFYDFVERLASREIIGGYACGGAGEPCGSDNLPYFRPNAQVTRGQTSKIVAIADNLPAPTPGQQTFEDVAPNSTFWQWVESLATAGTIGGYPCGGAGEPCGSGNLPYFRPSSNVTRGQAAKIVSNTFFPDCDSK